MQISTKLDPLAPPHKVRRKIHFNQKNIGYYFCHETPTSYSRKLLYQEFTTKYVFNFLFKPSKNCYVYTPSLRIEAVVSTPF